MMTLESWLTHIEEYVDSHIRLAKFQSNDSVHLSIDHLHIVKNSLTNHPPTHTISTQKLSKSFFKELNLPLFDLANASEFENHLIPFLFIVLLKSPDETLTQLLSMGLDPNTLDTRGFSALHICRLFGLGNKEIILKNAGAIETATYEGLTVQDIAHLNLATYLCPDMKVSSKTLQKFIPFFCFKPEDLPKLWLTNFQVIRPTLFSTITSQESKRITEIFTTYINHKYATYESQEFSTQTSSLPVEIIDSPRIPGEYDLIATQDIPAGTIIEYAGVESIDYTPSDRNFSGLDSRDYGNCAQFINDAPPKSKYISWNWKGIPRILVLTTTSIQKGELINIYYGPKHCIRLKSFDHHFVEFDQHLTNDFINSENSKEFITFNDRGFWKKTLTHNQVLTTQIETPKTDQEIIDLFLIILRDQTIWSYILTSPIVICRVSLELGESISKGLFFDVFQILFDREMKQDTPWALRFYELLCTLDTIQSTKTTAELKEIYQELIKSTEPIQAFLEKVIDAE